MVVEQEFDGGNSFGCLGVWMADPRWWYGRVVGRRRSSSRGKLQAMEDGWEKLGLLECEWQATGGGSSNDFGKVESCNIISSHSN